MKTYDVSTYNNWNDLSADMTAELNELITLPIAIEHATYGDGDITALTVSISDSAFHILSVIDFGTQIKTLALDVIINRNLVEILEPTKSILKDYIIAGIALQGEVKKTHSARVTAQFEADRQAKELAKQEAKYKATMEKAIREFETMAKQERPVSATGEFYYSLGWIAKNVGTISAALPDYLLPYFESQFGTGYTPTVVDSKKRTVNGNAMQWTLSMRASISKKAVPTIPAFLQQYLNPTGTALTNTSFIWDLVDKYGFQFGKTQDVNKIRDSLNPEYVEYFDKGYAA